MNERRATDIAAYRAAAKSARGKLRREFRRLLAEYGADAFINADINTDPRFERYCELVRFARYAQQELTNIRNAPDSYYD